MRGLSVLEFMSRHAEVDPETGSTVSLPKSRCDIADAANIGVCQVQRPAGALCHIRLSTLDASDPAQRLNVAGAPAS
jgi:hypothetical protein